MRNEGDLRRARADLLRERPANLIYLLRSRFDWMNRYVNGKANVIEIGAGAGLSKEFISNPRLKLTDFENPNEWIDQNVDALNMPFDDDSIDVVISSHMIHHLATPAVFFREITRVLKPGGLLLVNEINTSVVARMFLRVMRHEGWSYEIDVFDEKVIANVPDDPWSANCAIPDMLFGNPKRFHNAFSRLRIIRSEMCEFLTFPLSGGVTAKTRTINLPYWALNVIGLVDRCCVTLAPSVCAFARRLVIEKA
jgi:SAM-dependent methyltransferase